MKARGGPPVFEVVFVAKGSVREKSVSWSSMVPTEYFPVPKGKEAALAAASLSEWRKKQATVKRAVGRIIVQSMVAR